MASCANSAKHRQRNVLAATIRQSPAWAELACGFSRRPHGRQRHKGSGTDEALIYNNGRASLYYVWELSGQLNHCRLRVREK